MNINNNDITVVIPMYNSQKTIIRTLDSICNQTGINYIKEIVLVDDGSTDETYNIVNDYRNHAKTNVRIIKKENSGVSSARNIGIKSCDTKWIAFCDSDDFWVPKKLAVQANFINNNIDVDFVGTNHTKKVLKILGKKIDTIHKATVKELCIKMYPQTSTVLIKKKVCEKCGYFDEKQRYSEDANFFIKVAHDFNYYYIPEQLVIYDNHQGESRKSGLSRNLKEMHKGEKKILENFIDWDISPYFFI
ncbi:glycosyltransferase family A protein [Thomasclavelia sp.]|uniref:glycosyltransferase family 2 protein n=1 Tax=Thomasclavelia sp. TaxID=3025757 RepID=UPI0025EF31B0|nr:glycosyltransferase family A protein [Thomasclavelia sp.]